MAKKLARKKSAPKAKSPKPKAGSHAAKGKYVYVFGTARPTATAR